jgi:hypothetical protein
LANQLHRDYIEHLDAWAQSQDFVDELHRKYGTEQRILTPPKRPKPTWDDTLFGFPLKRFDVEGNVIAVEVTEWTKKVTEGPTGSG